MKKEVRSRVRVIRVASPNLDVGYAPEAGRRRSTLWATFGLIRCSKQFRRHLEVARSNASSAGVGSGRNASQGRGGMACGSVSGAQFPGIVGRPVPKAA
jgi:hypothetical protein